MDIKVPAAHTSFSTEAGAILRLAWPIMGAQLLMLSMVFVDNVMVGHLGPDALAAMSMASAFYGSLFIFAIGMMSALSPLISHAFGAKRLGNVVFFLRQGFFVAAALMIFMILVITQSDDILGFLGQKPSLIPLAKQFLMAIAWGIPAQVFYLCIRQFTEGTSDTRPSIITVGIGTVLNFLLDYALIYGNWGFPRLEVPGSGYATAIVQWVMALSMIAYITWSPRYRSFHLWKGSFKPHWHTIKEIVALGLPLSGGMLSEVVFFAGATLTIGTIGSLELASHQIALNAASITFMVPLGLSIATGIRIGQLAGVGERQGIRRIGFVSLCLTLAIQSIPALGFILFPRMIAGIYTSSSDIIDLSTRFLVIAGIFQVFDGLQVVGIGALRGIRDTRRPFINAFISYWLIGEPIALALTYLLKIGPTGLWYGMLVGLSVATAFHWIRFHFLTRTTSLHWQGSHLENLSGNLVESPALNNAESRFL